MALNDREHVEAVAIMRRFVEFVDSGAWSAEDESLMPLLDTTKGAKQWLAENHPEPSVYVGAVSAQSLSDESGRQ